LRFSTVTLTVPKKRPILSLTIRQPSFFLPLNSLNFQIYEDKNIKRKKEGKTKYENFSIAKRGKLKYLKNRYETRKL
jgi:hypothetical protein